MTDTQSIAEKMCLSEPTTKKINEDKPILSAAKKCRAMTLVSGDIRFMRIFAAVPGEGASNDSEIAENSNFQLFRWLFFRIL